MRLLSRHGWSSLLALAGLVLAACSGDGGDETGGQASNIDASSGPKNPVTGDAADRTPAAEDPTRFVDTCVPAESQCTAAPAGFKEGGGTAPVDRCAFALNESAGLGAPPPLVGALEKITKKVTVGAVLADANRTAEATTSVPGSPAGIGYAFHWADDDNASEAWIPQGITGTPDADATGKVDGKSAVLVSFYDKAPDGAVNRGVRIAFVDTTTPSAPKYRFALLVSPKGTEAAPSYDPVKIHAGGIAWYGNYLYVADTTRGLRVFDMRQIFEVTSDGTNTDVMGCTGTTCRAFNYKYVLPQVGKYDVASACKPLFSFVSLDRDSNPPSLISGEYCSGDACSGPLAGRVYRWPLDAGTGLLRSKTTYPTEAFLMSHRQVQGAASYKGTFYLSSSAPAGAGGDLFRVTAGKSATSNWSDSPEDLMVDHGKGWMWSLSEHANARAVYAVKLASYPAL